MLRVAFGLFIVLHGLVHLLYFGHARRLFELQPGMAWPDGSWAFAKVLGEDATRTVASIAMIVAAVAFLAGGAAVLLKGGWWRPALVGAAGFASVVFVLLWDGQFQNLDDKGGIGLLINVAILVAVLILRWPDLDF
jgi:uncharacterized membrane protein YphA (DoxX/SURF4 family)